MVELDIGYGAEDETMGAYVSLPGRVDVAPDVGLGVEVSSSVQVEDLLAVYSDEDAKTLPVLVWPGRGLIVWPPAGNVEETPGRVESGPVPFWVTVLLERG